MQSHEIEYRVHGEDLQFVEVYLDQNETVIGEAGAMMYMDDGVEFEAKMGDGTQPEEGFFGKMKGAAKRAMTGEGLFLTHFTNVAGHKRRVAFASPIPGRIIAIDLSQSGGKIICQKQAFLAAAMGTEISITTAWKQDESESKFKKMMTSAAGGEGWFLQTLEGDGLAFMNAGGMVAEHQLQGNRMKVDTGCVVAFDAGVNYSVTRAGSLKSSFLGGEGLLLATLEGHGRIWLQSIPMNRLGDAVTKNSPWLRRELRDLKGDIRAVGRS